MQTIYELKRFDRDKWISTIIGYYTNREATELAIDFDRSKSITGSMYKYYIKPIKCFSAKNVYNNSNVDNINNNKRNKKAFVKVYEELFNIELSALEMLIISKVRQFNENNQPCYLTANQFAEMFHCTEQTINKAIKRLNSAECEFILYKKTVSINNGGSTIRRRKLSYNPAALEKLIGVDANVKVN